MTLHEAIEHVINLEGKPLSARQIAIAINNLSIYSREDKKPLEPSQVAARISNHPSVFGRTNEGLIYVKKEIKIIYSRLVNRLRDLLRNYESRNVDVLIATCLFLERARNVFPEILNQFKESSFHVFTTKNAIAEIGEYETGFFMTKEDEILVSDLFQNISSELGFKIFDVLSEFDFSIEASSHSQFGNFFSELLNTSTLSKGSILEFATPSSVSQIIADLADIKDTNTIFDPFGGNAGLFSTLVRTKDIDCFLKLNDINKYCVWLGKMNLVVNNFGSFEYSYQDSIEEFVYNQDSLKKFDWIITHPPFGTRLSSDILHGFNSRLFGPSNKAEVIYFEMILTQLKTNGKAIVIVPESFLFLEDKANLYIREFLVKEKLIRSVISLPSDAFQPYTSAKASILFIDKDVNSCEWQGVKFIDLIGDDLKMASSDKSFSLKELISKNPSRSKIVTTDKIEKERYSLVANRYLLKETVFHSDEHKQLKELIKARFSGFTYSQKALNRVNGVPYVNIKDLAEESSLFYLNQDKIETFVDSEVYRENERQRQIKKGTIFLAKIGNKLKPTLNMSDGPLAVSGNILIIEPKIDIITPTYLLSQFYEEYVLSQVDRIRGGAAQLFVRIEDLLNISIKVPPVSVQKDIEMVFALEQMQNTPTKNLKNITASREEIDLPSAIDHEFKNLKNPLSSNILNIKDFLAKKITNKELINWDDKVAQSNGARSIEVVFNDVNEILGEMSSLIEDIVLVANLDKEANSLNKKNILVLPYFEKTVKKIQGEILDVDLNIFYSEKKMFHNVLIQIDENLFTKVIRNFVMNSLKHGYSDHKEKPVYIILSVTEDDLMLQIDLLNDGKPFPEGFTFNDFISFGKKSGANKGSGIGGFIMNQIILHHGGNWTKVGFDESNSLEASLTKSLNIGVHFRIKLPLIK